MKTTSVVLNGEARGSCQGDRASTRQERPTSAAGRFRKGVRALTALVALLGLITPLQASHYAGGQITYTYTGVGNVYTITETVYRDCAGITLGTTSSINITNNVGAATIPGTLNRTTFSDITPLCPGQQSRCATTAGAYGIEEHIYTGNFTLNPLANNGVYTIASTATCCRNNAITTITSPGSQEMYLYTTLNPSLSPRNNSPVFLNRPIAFLCANQPATLSPNAFDPDGDALQYSLSPCLDLSVNDPVTYASGFSATSPLSTSGGVSINASTGEIAFTPTVINQVAVICIKASEYRNGVKIGEIVRDIQVRILNCNNTPPAVAPISSVVVPVGTTFCTPVSATDVNGQSITLTATSGIIPPATFTVTGSGAGFANGQFCWTPTAAYAGNTYTVTINAVDNGCPVVASGSGAFNITVPIPCNVTASASSTPAACGVNNGSATASMTGGTFPYQYIWTGPGGYSSSIQSPTGLAAGTYSVTIIDGNGCTASTSTTVQASGSNVTASATSTGASCGQNNGTVTVTASGGNAPYTYRLNGGAGQSSNVFTGLAAGTYTVQVSDVNGCSGSTTVTVGNAPDVTAPVLTCPSNIVLGTSPNICGAPASFGATATDNCGPVTVIQTGGLTSGSTFPVGVSTVSYAAVDNAGNTANCSFTVSVSDDDAPVAVCQNLSIGLVGGQASISAEDIDAGSTDNCGIVSIVATPTSFDCSNAGNNTVVLTVADAAGNAASCVATVTVTDGEAPIAVCQHLSVQLDANGQASISAEDIDGGSSDNCGIVTISATPTSFTCANVGDNTVTLTVGDAAGNTASCTAIVEVTDDIAPTALCTDYTYYLDETGFVRAQSYEVGAGSYDNCAIDTMILVNCSLFCDAVGTAEHTLIVIDESGNTSTCTADITVLDTISPTAVCMDVQLSLDGSGNVSINSEDLDGGSYDNCGIVSIVASQTNFDCSNVGVNTVTLTVTDASGNSGTCSATVTIVDEEAPSIACPADISVGTAAPLCGAPVSFAVNGNDNCSVQISTSLPSGHIFSVGTTTVDANAVDPSGNSAACSFTVTVSDDDAPSALCNNVGVVLDANGQGSITVAQVDNGSSDNCGIASLTLSNSSFTCANTGANSVTLTVVDLSGNTSTCTANVTVVDINPPVVTCPANISVNNDPGVCGANVSYSASATDNCSATVALSIASGSFFSVGTTGVSATATDASGNTALCTFTVTVSDNEAPAAVCQNQTVSLNANGLGSITAEDIDAGSTDNCGISGIAVSQTLFNCSHTGGNTVTLTVTDIHGNSSTCTATVTVVDAIAPVATCPANISVNNDAGLCGAAVSYNPSASDNCSATLAVSIASGSFFAVGTTTVTAVATDPSGNTSSCAFTVTVSDNEAPLAVCQNLTVVLDAAGQGSTTAAAINNGSSDNCGIASISATPTSFTCANVGGNTVTLTVTDIHGNSSTCTATVAVVDNTAPVAVCQNLTINIGSSGSVGVSAAQINNGSSDACGIQSLALSQTSFACADLGSNPVVLTVTDVNGNVSTCSAVVTVTNDPLVLNLSAHVYQCGYNISCNGASDGSILSTTTGGCLPYSYAWSNGAATANVTSLAAGTYTLTVTDANGNATSATVTLTQAAPLSLTLSSPTFVGGWNISCHGASDGSINLAPAGGSSCQGYAYNWSGPGGFHSSVEDPSGLVAGTYNVTIMDANGCTATSSITLTQPTPVTAEAGNNVLVYWGYTQQYNCTTLNGSYAGGTPGYTRTWSTASGVIATGNSVTVCPTTSTTYYFTVVDANGCTALDSVRVCVLDLSCTDRTNNGQNGSGQSGNGVNNGNGGGQGLTHIAVCHVPPGNPSRSQTKCIPIGAVPNMLAQGSYLGGCGVAPSYVCNFSNGSRMASAGADSKSDLQVTAFPNPTTGQVSVQLSCTECGSQGKFSVKVVNLVGQELKTSSIAMANGQGMTEFDLSSYANGFYFIVVENGTERVVEKIMKN
jgi:hypothetical protein